MTDPTLLTELEQIEADLASGAGSPSGATSNVAVTNFPVMQTVADAAVEAGIGTPADPAYSGTGSGGLISLIKNLVAKFMVAAGVSAPTALGVQGVYGGIAFSVGGVSTTAPTDANRLAVSNPDCLQFSNGGMNAVGVLNSIDTLGYSAIAVQLTGTWVGTVVFETSGDGNTWVPAYGFSPSASVASPVASAATVGMWIIPVTLRFFRTRISVFTSGVVTQIGWLRDEPVAQLDPQATARATSSTLVPPALAAISLSTTKIISAATTNALLLRPTSTNVLGWVLGNSGTTWAYLKLINLATTPVPGTSAVMHIIPLPPGQTVVYQPPYGMVSMTTGCGYTITGGSADTDTTAVALGQVTGHLLLK